MDRSSSRGQAYTLEGVIAALIIASSVLVGLQAVDTTPWTTGSTEVLSEQRQTQADDLLATTYEDGSMVRAISCVDDGGDLTSAVIDLTDFGERINESLAQRGFGYRLSVAYWNASSDTRDRVVLAGSGANPGSDAVTATRRAPLTDEMQSYDINSAETCEPRDETVSENSDFYAPQVDSSSSVYNVVEVRLDVWSVEQV